jgi:hypothetical protein
MRTIPIALLTGLILLPLAAGANPIGPSWIYSLVQSGEDVEIVTRHLYLQTGAECVWLVRQTADGDLKVIDDGVPLLLEDHDAQCGLYCDAEGGPDAEYCAAHPEECEDCDEDAVPECPGPCEADACELFYVDHCVPPGTVSYALFSVPGAECELDCGSSSTELVDVTDEGQSCPPVGDAFECIETAIDDGDEAGDGGDCSVSRLGADASAGGLGLALLGVGLAALRIARRRQPRWRARGAGHEE